MSGKPKIVVIGSCCFDFITYTPRLPNAGETVHGTKFVTNFGGKGANQCVAAAKLGGNTYMIAKLGDDQWGMQYLQYLKEIGVNVTNVDLVKNATTGVAQISVDDFGENQIVNVRGANDLLQKIDVKNAAHLIQHADILISQLETPFETTLEAFKLNKGLRLFNAAPARPEIRELLPYCSIVCVNENEASIIAGLNDKVNIFNAASALEKILTFGCDTVIVTLGEKGAVYLSKKDPRPIHVFSNKVTAVDTTGAGDAFVGALAVFLASHKDKPLHQIVGAACEVATISVTKEGTQTSYPSNFSGFDKEYKYVEL